MLPGSGAAAGVKINMLKNGLRYVAILLIFGSGILFIIWTGTRLYPEQARPAPVSQQSPETAPAAPNPTPAGASGGLSFANLRRPLGNLLLQLIVVLLAAKAVGMVFQRLFRLTVVGEMFAGILLGPSLLGVVSPGTMHFLFPPNSLEFLSLLSQIGAILFMFIVGTELNTRHVSQNAHVVVLLSHAGIIIPFFLGMALSLLMYGRFAPPHVSFHAFSLFISVSMSVTAFPVLARILEERRMTATHVGATAIACAAIDDITAWCLLAVVVAVAQASGLGAAVLTIVSTLLFAGFMLLAVRPLAGRVLVRELGRETPHTVLTAAILTFVFASALCTEVIGIHALFGAFLAGVAVPPHPKLRSQTTRHLETMTTSLLLPLYFAFTGLRTQIGLLDRGSDWLMCAGVVLVAVAGKLCGGALSARLTGMGWHDSLTLGVLLNTRGLVELIVLNVGYDLGILSPEVYSMMVIMALTTTFMTGPLLSLLDSRKPARSEGPL